MSDLDNDRFIEFLKSFNDGIYKGKKFYDTITEISRKESGKREPLIENNKKMYSLDDIAKGSKVLRDNLPKTTDAICFKNKNGNFSLYLIEFKFHNLDDPDAKDYLESFAEEVRFGKKNYNCLTEDQKNKLYKINKYYGDDVSHALILKPIESLKVAIPQLYNEYCEKRPNLETFNIESFLNNIEKNYVVFVSTYSSEGKLNPENERLLSQGTKLEQHFDRLKFGNIIDNYEIWPRCDFDDFLEIEQLSWR